MRLVILLPLLVLATACPPPPQTNSATRATSLVSTTLENGTFLKKGDTFTVTADGEGVVSALFGPRQIPRFVTHSAPTATFDAAEFPEGGAPLIFALSERWTLATLTVEQVWIDHSPPVLVRAENTEVGADQSIRLLVWDAVALSRADLKVGDRTIERHLPRTTASSELTVIELASSELEEGHLDLELTLWDAAGNSLKVVQPVLVDRTAPQVQILSPAPGAQVSGLLQIELSATDNFGISSVEVRANGSLVAMSGGALSSLELDSALFPSGPLELTAVPKDRAGNLGEAVSVTVMVD